MRLNLTQSGFNKIVETEFISYYLLLSPSAQSRLGWETLFESNYQEKDHKIFSLQNEWDDEEWEW